METESDVISKRRIEPEQSSLSIKPVKEHKPIITNVFLVDELVVTVAIFIQVIRSVGRHVKLW